LFLILKANLRTRHSLTILFIVVFVFNIVRHRSISELVTAFIKVRVK
jgi:hypothetical protein